MGWVFLLGGRRRMLQKFDKLEHRKSPRRKKIHNCLGHLTAFQSQMFWFQMLAQGEPVRTSQWAKAAGLSGNYIGMRNLQVQRVYLDVLWQTKLLTEFSPKLTSLVLVIYFFTGSVFLKLPYARSLWLNPACHAKKVCCATGAATVAIFNRVIKPRVIKSLVCVRWVLGTSSEWDRGRDK